MTKNNIAAFYAAMDYIANPPTRNQPMTSENIELRKQVRELAAQLLAAKKQLLVKNPDIVFASALNDLYRAEKGEITPMHIKALLNLLLAGYDSTTLKMWIDEITTAEELEENPDGDRTGQV